MMRESKIEQRPMSLAEQKKVYEAIKIVHEAEQAWWFAVNDGTSGGNPIERYIVLALLEAGWTPPPSSTEDDWVNVRVKRSLLPLIRCYGGDVEQLPVGDYRTGDN